MWTMEKQWVQIFERQEWVINQAKQQAFLLDQDLSSKLLLAGIPTLPASLALNHEELISEVPFPRTRRAISFDNPVVSGAHYRRQVANGVGDDVRLCPIGDEGLCASSGGPLREDASVDSALQLASVAGEGYDVGQSDANMARIPEIVVGFDEEDRREEDPSVALHTALTPVQGEGVSDLRVCHNSDAARSIEGAIKDCDEENPQDKRDVRMSEGDLDPAVSLARLQRSKSRQRALEIRNSTQKSRSRGKDNAGDYAGGAIKCLISTPHSENVKASNGNHSVEEKAKIGDFQTEERGSHVHSGRVTRSRRSDRQENSLNFSSSPCIAGDFIGKLTEKSNPVIHSPEMASSSRIADDSGRGGELKSRDRSSKGKQHVVETPGSSHDALGNEGGTGCEGVYSSPNGMLISLHEGKEPSYSSSIKQAAGRPHDSLLKETGSALPTSIDIDGRSHCVRETVHPNALDFGDPIQFSDFPGSTIHVKSSQPAIVDELYDNHPKMVEPKTVELHVKEEGSNMMSGRITRSRIFGNQENFLNDCCLPDIDMTSSGTTVNIDSTEQSSLDGRSTPASRKEIHGNLSEKMPLSFVHAEKEVAEGTITTTHGNYDSPLNVNIMGNYEVSAKEMEVQSSLAEAVDELTESRRLSNVNERSSVEKADDVDTDAGANTLLESGQTLQQKCSVIDDQAPLQVGSDCLVHSPVNEASEVNAEKSKELVSEESAVNSVALNCPSKSTDEDYSSVSRPGSHRFLDTETLEKFNNPNATSKNELRSYPVPSTETAYISPENLQTSAIDDREKDGLEPKECQTAENSKLRITFYSRYGTSSKHKRRKIDERVHDLSTSITLREDDFHAVKNDSDCGNLEREDYSPMAVPHIQGLTPSQEYAGEITVSGSHAEDHMVERSESLPQAQKIEGGTGLEGVDGSPNVPFTFSHEQNESSVFSRLLMQFPEHPREFLLDGIGRALPTNINNTGGSHSLIKDPLFLHNLDDKRLESAENAEERFGFEGTNNFTELSSSAPHVKSMDLTIVGDEMPLLEKFVITTDDDSHSIAEERSVFDEWNLPNYAVEHASFLEQLCLSACMQTPEAFASASYQLQRVEHLQKSVHAGVSEHIDLQTALHVINNVEQIENSNCCWTEEVGPAFNGISYSDCLPNFSGQSGWDIKKPCSSPVGKVWDKISSSSSSSGKRVSSVPVLACINEEIENADEGADTFQEIENAVLDYSPSRPPLADITEIPNLPASVSKAEPYTDRLSLDSVTTEFSLTGTRKSVRKKPGIQNSAKRRYNNKENQSILRGTKDNKRATGSLQNRYNKPKVSEKSILRKGPSLSELEPKPNNIVTNITSFIPLVQQKQAAAALPVKRDIKVKSLEAAEAAKRLAERKDNERKMKKEAMKVERARVEQENLRKLELQKKMKEEERLKNEAEMAAKKRQREEEDKKEKQKKRMRVDAAWREQKEHEERSRVEKVKKELKCHANDGRGHRNKDVKCNTLRKKGEEEMEHETIRSILETDHTRSSVSANNARAGTAVQEDYYKDFTDFEHKEEVHETLDKATPNEKLVVEISREQSYDISPYKESDDEDDDDEDSLPNNKFIPSWASKSCLAVVASRQSVLEPEMIFNLKSFPSISEVLLPRKYQIQ